MRDEVKTFLNQTNSTCTEVFLNLNFTSCFWHTDFDKNFWWRSSFNRIQGTCAYLRPGKQQASLRARDLARSHKLVGVGHCFGKVSVLAILSSQIYPEKLELTSNADRLKFNGRLAQIYFNLIGQAIVAFVCRKLSNFCESRKSQIVQTHKTQCQKASWHTGYSYSPSVSSCGSMYKTHLWHIS